MMKKMAMICLISMALLVGLSISSQSGTNEGGETLQEGSTDVATDQVKIRKDTNVIQTMIFSRCNHQVQRRISPPESLIGADFETVKKYYDLWNLASMTTNEVEMERNIDLFCPAHTVLSLDMSGQLVMAENRYGDGMAILKTYEWKIPQEMRDSLIAGIGFDSREEAEKWLIENGIAN